MSLYSDVGTSRVTYRGANIPLHLLTKGKQFWMIVLLVCILNSPLVVYRLLHYNCESQYMDTVCDYNAIISVYNVFLVCMVLSSLQSPQNMLLWAKFCIC